MLNGEFDVLGHQVSTGRWYTDVTNLRSLARAASVPQFNGGVLAFRSGPISHAVFAYARDLASRYGELGFDTFNGGVADEPLLSIALAARGIEARDLVGAVSATLIGLSGRLHVDVLHGNAVFTKHHQVVSPAVVHFAADFSSPWRIAGSYYRRERFRLRLAVAHRWPPWAARLSAALLHGPACRAFDAFVAVVGRAPRDGGPAPQTTTAYWGGARS